jgi:predicted metal-binding protein
MHQLAERSQGAGGSNPRAYWSRCSVPAIDELTPVIAAIISGHCPGTRAREDFVSACVHSDWAEARVMAEGMLAEPWHLIGSQENRLREFLELLRVAAS